jgi:putative PIN family toxin of toxin-antitoxin system
MKVCLDTNVLVAAFATRGLCEDVMRVVLAEHELILAEDVLDELERVLVEKLGISAARTSTITAFLRDQAHIIAVDEPAAWPERDRDDQWVVAAAIEGRADVLVTGDRDLLDAAEGIPVAVLSPRAFWDKLR